MPTWKRPRRQASGRSDSSTVAGRESERAIRQVLPEMPHLRIGTAIVVPIEALKKWLNDQAKVEESRIDAAVEEILEGLESGD